MTTPKNQPSTNDNYLLSCCILMDNYYKNVHCEDLIKKAFTFSAATLPA